MSDLSNRCANGPRPADRKGDCPPAATRPSGRVSEDSLSERTRAPALEAKRKTKRQATSAVAHVAPVPAADDPLLAFAPYLHTQPRRNSITPDKQRAFIAALAATGIVTRQEFRGQYTQLAAPALNTSRS